MYYFMITSAAFLFSLQFVFNHGYQRENESGMSASLRFSLYTSLFGLVWLLLINRFHMELTLFSILVAVADGFVSIGFSYCSIKAFQYANLSVYSVFSMIGGMVLPFVYGVVCGEELTAVRLICCVLIVISVAMPLKRSGGSRKAVKYYIGVFVLNGMVGVLSEFHQSHQELCVDSASFMMLRMLSAIVLSALFLLARKERNFGVSKKSLIYCAGYSGFNSIGNLLLLIALLHLHASVQYPIVTGGVIVFSTLIDLLRKERVSKRELLAAALAFAASALMAL